MLVSTTRWLRAFHWDAIEGCLKQFDVVGVGAAYLDAQRHAVSIGEHRPLGSQFTTIGRVFSGFFPRPEAIWSSLRPRFANSTGSLLARRIQAEPPSTACGKHLPFPTLGSNGAGYSPNHTPRTILFGRRLPVRKT